MATNKKIFVSGCFDMLHSGHVAFLKEAAKYGDVMVGLGSDETVYNLKGRYPINNQSERKYMLEALSCVAECRINKGSGLLDFIEELETIKPDIFLVNEDGNSPAKQELCENYGIEYLVLSRTPHAGLPRRSTTSLKCECTIPYRIDVAGGWLDQPYVGKLASGPVITISIEPTIEFNERSGMATSTRRQAIKLWNTSIPSGDREQLSRILFGFENPPGTEIITGSQDAIGIVMPCLNKLDYTGGYWPEIITNIDNEKILSWLENHLYLIPLTPRQMSYDVLSNRAINQESAKALADAASRCWEAILSQNLLEFGKYFRLSFEAQTRMFPHMLDQFIDKTIEKSRGNSLGWKLSGAGGGGYLILVSEEPIQGAIKIRIRRKETE